MDSEVVQAWGVYEMKDSIEPQKDLADETTYSVEEAKEMGAFVEDALSFTDARESVDDFFESEK
jgi:hypothetical protein